MMMMAEFHAGWRPNARSVL
jgi:hypothetical protein